MNRSSRGSADEAADALLDAGRTQPALHYDVELGLARHHRWLRSNAPMPEWADTSVATAAKSLVPVAIKTIVSAVLMGALAFAAWHARSRPQPSAADVKPSSPALERSRDVAASESWMATTPMPISDQDLPTDPQARRAVRADVPNKRITRTQRAHKELASARAANAAAAPVAEPARATPDRVESAARAGTRPSEDVGVERTLQHEVAATRERAPISAARSAPPESAPRAQAPDDLAEMQQVATAEHLLERSPERALALVRQGDRHFARGYFQQERAYIAIMALIGLGRIDEARTRAASFAKQFPALPYGARIRSALEAVP
jgi:hypothetical protein